MRKLFLIVTLCGLALPTGAFAHGVGLIPLHSFEQQLERPYGKNISLHGTPGQIEKLRKWVARIASVPRGLDVL